MLDGNLVRLRPYRKEDVSTAYDCFSKVSVRRMLMGDALKPFRMEDEEEWYAGLGKNHAPLFAIERIEDGMHLGGTGLNHLDLRNRVAELGIMLNEPFWGKGYGTEAFVLCIDYAFREFNLNKVTLGVYSWNPRAIHVYEKLGFVREGVLRQQVCMNHQFYDSIRMGMLHSEWMEARSRFQHVLANVDSLFPPLP